MRRLKLVLALGAVALLALSGIAVAKDHGGNANGHHGRHHQRQQEFPMREAGTVSSFDAATGKLTIALTGGESVTGLVTEATRIDCEGVDDRLDRRDHGGSSGSGSGDDNGGQEEPGDDNGGEEPAGAATCSTASLTPGAVVGDAELRLEGGMAVFEEVELGFHS
ncbi:MAG TPA: hypothetical protein VGH14_02200 [Solirubrobacterales bacterium]|jgi:opacity protein-like surface antigen